jgi:hypothetical protein
MYRRPWPLLRIVLLFPFKEIRRRAAINTYIATMQRRLIGRVPVVNASFTRRTAAECLLRSRLTLTSINGSRTGAIGSHRIGGRAWASWRCNRCRRLEKLFCDSRNR